MYGWIPYKCTVVALRVYEHTLYNCTVAGLRPYTRSPFNLEIAAQALSKGQISSLIAIWMASFEMLLFLRLYLTIPYSLSHRLFFVPQISQIHTDSWLGFKVTQFSQMAQIFHRIIPRNPMKKIYEETKKRNTTLHLFNNGTNCLPGTLAEAK